jgi:hypothetical protein
MEHNRRLKAGSCSARQEILRKFHHCVEMDPMLGHELEAANSSET